MRLFEVIDSGHIDNVLRILQARANAKGGTLDISFSAFKNMTNSDDMAVSTPDALIQWKNEFDKNDKIIKAIEKNPNTGEYTVFVNTTNQAAVPDSVKNKPNSPSLQQMASSNAQQAISPKI